MPRILQTIVTALAVAPVALGHTWIEQLRNVNDKGQYVGEYGYPRGMVSKTDPGFDGNSMNFEIPAYQGGKVFIQNDTMLCHESQRQQKQSQDKYPRLEAAPGGFIAMRYMENGHITLPQNQKGKPKKAGTIFIYGTTQPKQDEKIANVLRWTEDGKGGDGRGVLLTMNDFDDGRCYENNNSPIHKDRVQSSPNYAMGQTEDGPGTMPLFCESNVQLPKTAAMGKPYTFYWVWQWNTAPGIDPGLPNGKDEYYSTCIDVDVASKDTALATKSKPKYALGQQDAMSIAVKDWSSRTALMTNAIQGEVGPIFGGGKQTSAPSAPGGAPSGKPSPPQASAPSGKPPKVSGEPAIPTLTGRPGRPGRPSAAPSKSYDGPIVTVTDTVFITMTAPAASRSAPPAAGTSKPARASSVKSLAPPPAGVTPPASRPPPGAAAPSAGIPSPPAGGAPGPLPGFNMRNPNGAKFRAMLT